MEYLPQLATIEQTCEWLEKKTNEKWILPRLIECGLRPYFWIDYTPDHPELFGNRDTGFLSEMIYGCDTMRLAAGLDDVVVKMFTSHDGIQITVGEGWRFPLSELKFKREEIEETAKLINDEKNNANASIELRTEKIRGITKEQVLIAFELIVRIDLKKALGNGKGLYGEGHGGARTRKGTRGGRHAALWNPVLLAISWEQDKKAALPHLKQAFLTHSFLSDWLDDWKDALEKFKL